MYIFDLLILYSDSVIYYMIISKYDALLLCILCLILLNTSIQINKNKCSACKKVGLKTLNNSS